MPWAPIVIKGFVEFVEHNGSRCLLMIRTASKVGGYHRIARGGGGETRDCGFEARPGLLTEWLAPSILRSEPVRMPWRALV